MFSLFKQTFSDFSEDRCMRIAAALAYYTAFSIAPMLVLITSVVQLVMEPEDIQGRFEQEISTVVGQEGVDQIRTMMESSEKDEKNSIYATLIGVVVMILGATGVFAQLQTAMNDVWQVRPDPEQGGIKNFLMKRLLSLGMVLTIAFLLMVGLVASGILHAFDDVIDRWLPGMAASLILRTADTTVSFAIITLLFAAIFKVLPDAEVAWRHVWVGALFTAALFVVGRFGLALYLGSRNMATTYGAAGSLILILMWVYYSTIILLLGAEFTQAWARRKGAGIRPTKGAVRVVRHTEDVRS